MLMSFARLWNRRGERKSQPIRKHATPTKKKPPTRPTLEALEDRLVPTVAFTPQLGTTTVTSSSSANALSLHSPPVVLIFTGNYWQNTTQGKQDEQNITKAVQDIIKSPYLSKLTQYGYQGTATYAAAHEDTATPKLDGTNGNTPSSGTLTNFVNNEIAKHPSWAPATSSSDKQQQPIYVVVNDPQDSSTASGTYGFNWVYNGSTTHAVYVGATANSSGGVNMDRFTAVFSHELAEAMAPYITVTDPGKFNQGSQIADNEPEQGNGYTYRLGNGGLVQAYWSQSDKAFVVPDGNTQTFTLQPIWSSNKFTGQYNLGVKGDQRGSSYNDQITISSIFGGGFVNLNGEKASFDAGKIKSINVNTLGGSNTVNVLAVSPGVAVNIDSWGQSNDTVTVGSNGSLAYIAGTVNVANSSGKTQLVVDDHNDTKGRTFGITNNQVWSTATLFGASSPINYTGASTNSNGALVGVTSLVVDGGSGPNTFSVNSTAANTPLTLNTGPIPLYAPNGSNTVNIRGSSSAVSVKSYGNDNVTIGSDWHSLAGIGGPVSVSNGSGQDNLAIDDSWDSSARSITITDNAVKVAAAGSEPVVTINYTPAQQQSNGQMIGVNQLRLWLSTHDVLHSNQVEVDSVGPNTPTTIYGDDTRDILTGPAAGKVLFKRYGT
jgi:hypothetical protein